MSWQHLLAIPVLKDNKNIRKGIEWHRVAGS